MKKLHAWELSRNQSILRFDVILQHDWPITGQSNNASSILGFSLAGKQRVHVLIFSSINLWNRWRTLTETIFQGHRKIALTWPLPESTKTMFKQYRIAFAPARKPYRIEFYSHIRTVVAARFRYRSEAAPRRSQTWSVTFPIGSVPDFGVV